MTLNSHHIWKVYLFVMLIFSLSKCLRMYHIYKKKEYIRYGYTYLWYPSTCIVWSIIIFLFETHYYLSFFHQVLNNLEWETWNSTMEKRTDILGKLWMQNRSRFAFYEYLGYSNETRIIQCYFFMMNIYLI